ncbi:uncharacterized aarF domain-containing protein kinase 5-like, partial [Plectropomus leopardus]|uniref:uncharacterized aarF domain-containing protein kinase 5-like n=1 Tax=Plectropomus leopardus TaxID=160734 RepID=UPI001C4A7776
LVRRGPDNKAELVLLDHGLYEYLSQRDRVALCKLWRSIVLRDEAAMERYSKALGIKEYFLFCEMLLQRPINMRELGLSNILSREETTYMREMASNRFDSIMQVLKAMPRPMLLVFRNVNTVRSINITLGAPVDRYFVMAKRSVQRQRFPNFSHQCTKLNFTFKQCNNYRGTLKVLRICHNSVK